MSEIIAEINPIYEAVRYLKARANGASFKNVSEKASAFYPSLKSRIEAMSDVPLKMEEILDRGIDLDEGELRYYFGTDSYDEEDYSLAQLILEPVTYCGLTSDIDVLCSALLRLPEEQRIHRFTSVLKHSDQSVNVTDYMGLVNFILSIETSSEEKVRMLDVFNNYELHLENVARLIRPVAELILKSSSVYGDAVKKWISDMKRIGDFESFLSEKYHVESPKLNYKIFPSLFQGLLFDLYFWNKPPELSPCCGEIAVSVSMIDYVDAISGDTEVSRIVSIIKGLADETRFELLLRISKTPCYSNALADMFKISQQKVFYHMTKLLAPNIVNADARNGKTYYSINKKAIQDLIYALKRLIESEEE